MPGPSSPGNIGKYLGLALALPIATFVGYTVGHVLDLFFHTTWIRWVWTGFGFIAGIMELIFELDKDNK